MNLRAKFLNIAAHEASPTPVNWNDYPDSILSYFEALTGSVWTIDTALEVSWCSYFVYWCLIEAGVRKVKVGNAASLGSMGSVGRFRKSQTGAFADYAVGYKKYVPRPGDIYNRAVPNNHIGIVADVKVDGKKVWIKSLDGNSGPMYFSEHFYKKKRKIGYGFVYSRTEWFELKGANDWWISLTDD